MVGLFLTALAFGLLVYAAQMVREAVEIRAAQEARTPPARERVFAVGVRRAVAGSARPVMAAYGELRAQRSLELRSAAAGRVIDLHPDFVEGGSIRAGDVLIRVEPAEAQAALDRATADLADARAEIRDAKAGLVLARDELAAARDQATLQERALARAKDLEGRGVGTTAAVENSELAAAAARASVLTRRQALAQAEAREDLSATRMTRMEIALTEAQRRLDDTVLVAPFDGVLSDVSVVEGRLLSGNERIADLVDPGALEVAFRLSTAQYARLLDETGALSDLPVSARLDVAGIELQARGRISRDSAAMGAPQTGRLVFATLESARGFKPGDFVTVAIEEPELDTVVRLPAAALNGSGTVLAVTEDNRLEALPVTLVRRQGNEVLVRGEALEGRDVVTARSPLLGAGISVRPLRRDGDDMRSETDMLELSAERRARLVAFVQANSRMPKDIKAQVLNRLQAPKVPAQMVKRIESRMGG